MVSILLPLYIYPSAGSWQPLLSMAQAHSNVDFLVIVNPHSGPGVEYLPDENYIEALRSLDSHPNVGLLGYVRSEYGDRDISEIGHDIFLYGGWEDRLASLNRSEKAVSLRGIFIDEATSEPEYILQMEDITSRIRSTWADVMHREATVVYNPGVVVDPSFYAHADLIVAFEEAEAGRPAFMDDGLSGVAWENRRKTAAIVHTYDGSWYELEALVGEMDDSGVGSLFVTDQAGGLYDKWPWTLESMLEIISERLESKAK